LTETPLPIPDLIAQLSDPDPAVRRAAAEALGDAKAVEAIEPLKQVILSDRDRDRGTRITALHALQDVGDASVLPFLFDLFSDTALGIAETAASVATYFKPFCIQPLMTLASNKQEPLQVRTTATYGLMCCASELVDKHNPTTIPELAEPIITLLLELCKDEQAEVAQSAVSAFRYVRVSRATQPLIPLLSDSSSTVRWAAVDSLACLGDAEAIDPIINCLKDPVAKVRAHAAYMLSCFDDTRCVPFLIESLQDADPHVQKDAVYTLGILKDARALESIRLLRQQAAGKLLFWCQWALVRMVDESALHPLIAYLPDDNHRLVAAEALGGFGNQIAVEPLIEAWKLGVKKSPLRIIRIRRFIVDALKKLDAPRALEAFTAIVGESDDPEMRKAAQTALDQLRGGFDPPSSGALC
jgi:HEAT repeat protein